MPTPRIAVFTAAALLLPIVSQAMAAAGPAAVPSTDVATTLQKLRVQEATAPIRENPRWRAPRKVLLLGWSNPAMTGRMAALQAAMPGARLVSATSRQAAIAEAADADVIVGANPDVCDRQILSAARELRWVQSLSAGVELCMQVPAIRAPNLLVSNMRGVDSVAIAEHAIAMLLSIAHGLDTFALDTARGVWRRERAASTPVQVLDGKTMLVVGLGGIGTEVAQRAAALGMKVVATDAGNAPRPAFVDQVSAPADLLKLASTADVIVSCVPLTPETTNLYDAKFFAALKPTAYFLNVARGASVVTDELVKALNEQRLAGAALDVVEPEPLPANHPLWKSPRVLITPHISSRSDLPGEGRWVLLAENFRRYAAGEKMLQVVDVQRGY